MKEILFQSGSHFQTLFAGQKMCEKKKKREKRRRNLRDRVEQTSFQINDLLLFPIEFRAAGRPTPTTTCCIKSDRSWTCSHSCSSENRFLPLSSLPSLFLFLSFSLSLQKVYHVSSPNIPDIFFSWRPFSHIFQNGHFFLLLPLMAKASEFTPREEKK